jgi:integrase
VAAPKVEREQRLPYSADDLAVIFSGPVHKRTERPKGGAGEAGYWLPLLALYTGARLEELGQLTRGDVRSERGAHFLLITDRGEGARVKAHSSRRRVPLHQKVLKLGFLDYVHSIKSATDPLWPLLRIDKHGARTQAFSKWFNRYADSLGIKDPRKVLHSFRHTFKVACRAAGISEEVHDRLTGHAGGSVGRTYGSGVDYPLAPLVAAVRKLKFSGFPPIRLDALNMSMVGTKDLYVAARRLSHQSFF